MSRKKWPTWEEIKLERKEGKAEIIQREDVKDP
jgi:hypothetical protein